MLRIKYEAKLNLFPLSLSSKIFIVRKQRVMIDHDLAMLYGVKTINSLSRNLERFSLDFMFELTQEEYDSLRHQNATLKRGEHSKYLPYVFTEHGSLMLSSVLNSENAYKISILGLKYLSE